MTDPLVEALQEQRNTAYADDPLYMGATEALRSGPKWNPYGSQSTGSWVAASLLQALGGGAEKAYAEHDIADQLLPQYEARIKGMGLANAQPYLDQIHAPGYNPKDLGPVVEALDRRRVESALELQNNRDSNELLKAIAIEQLKHNVGGQPIDTGNPLINEALKRQQAVLVAGGGKTAADAIFKSVIKEGENNATTDNLKTSASHMMDIAAKHATLGSSLASYLPDGIANMVSSEHRLRGPAEGGIYSVISNVYKGKIPLEMIKRVVGPHLPSNFDSPKDLAAKKATMDAIINGKRTGDPLLDEVFSGQLDATSQSGAAAPAVKMVKVRQGGKVYEVPADQLGAK